ncbi:hypothetical protein NHX12_017751, partial [Muraenolepis orangiensis]
MYKSTAELDIDYNALSPFKHSQVANSLVGLVVMAKRQAMDQHMESQIAAGMERQ